MKTKGSREKRINVITLGCSKNIVDSENLITQLRHNQYSVTHDAEDAAEIVIINTCGFIDVAKEESIDTILEYAKHKEEGRVDKLYVTGCLSQRYRGELALEIPEVDAWFGTLELPSLLHTLNADYKHELIGERSITTPSHYAYLKISEGCNRTCAFCAIPLMRGVHISRSIESLRKEAVHLASHGVKELMLIAQELTYYGLDNYKRRALPDLLNALVDVDGIEWIRLHYAYPHKFPLEVIQVMAERSNICKYLDMPLQHADDTILDAMRRQITQRETKELIGSIRGMAPDIALRTTFLVGFPGETEEQFDTLCNFVEEMRFDRVGVFEYSHEENTSGYLLKDDVPGEVKSERANRLLEIQRAISLDMNTALVGKVRRVLFDRKEEQYFVGRTESDSPEVDNEVYVRAENSYTRIGDFASVKITDASEYDLFGELVHP
ncbi:MAG TPA: 30S ribosomal protein S12 methylthiotransferase RimO [Saprospiraceae bacterium]|nr:30S ribosomal protein S12 methylthiotransferase RimO [Saprospiraceae bacterium]